MVFLFTSEHLLSVLSLITVLSLSLFLSPSSLSFHVLLSNLHSPAVIYPPFYQALARSGESVYDLIPPPPPVVIKPPMHRSKFPSDTAPTASTFGASAAGTHMISNAGGDYEAPAPAHKYKQPAASFGPMATIPKDPRNFTRSRGADVLPERT